MKMDRDHRRRLPARRAKVILLLQIVCLEVLSGVDLCSNAQILTKEDLQRELKTYEAASLQAETPNMPAIQAGQIWSRLGTLNQDAGMYGQSERAFEHAMRLLTIAPISNPDLATVIDNLGTLYMETGNVKEAEHAESKALKIREESDQDARQRSRLQIRPEPRRRSWPRGRSR